MSLTDLHRCPACYGVSVCPELYSNQITVVDYGTGWSNLFNAKNVYYGYTNSNRGVVLKKLAHDWELEELDLSLCKRWNLPVNCKPMDLANSTNIDEKIVKLVQDNTRSKSNEVSVTQKLVLCPYAYSVYDFVQPALNVIPKSRGWPVPAYGGVCGRLELVGYEGVPLSSLMHVEWHLKLKYARKILNAAMDFTYKHESSPFSTLFAMETKQICQHHLSDHNIWAACHVLANNHNPLLYPIPKLVNDTRPHFDRLLYECLHGRDRFRTVIKLQHVIDDMLNDEKVVGHG
ncbi:UPF0672 protein C3orf58-like protein [Operophtera brumata]|uniref:UPF0672 protein C3orf58-like protein n=1 Tax=Operophtera brumata TaxID=104452 RepID=A0A0L7K3L8_OPEBR|nr:UPF0672 protein C3orf58-like protein [Operophtera brumata]